MILTIITAKPHAEYRFEEFKPVSKEYFSDMCEKLKEIKKFKLFSPGSSFGFVNVTLKSIEYKKTGYADNLQARLVATYDSKKNLEAVVVFKGSLDWDGNRQWQVASMGTISNFL